jgi:hypothetical protein
MSRFTNDFTEPEKFFGDGRFTRVRVADNGESATLGDFWINRQNGPRSLTGPNIEKENLDLWKGTRELLWMAFQVENHRLEGIFHSGAEVSGTEATALDRVLGISPLDNSNDRETAFHRKKNRITFLQQFFNQIAHGTKTPYKCEMEIFARKGLHSLNYSFFAKKQRIFNKSSFFGDDRKKNQIVDARIFDNLRRSFWADMATAAG